MCKDYTNLKAVDFSIGDGVWSVVGDASFTNISGFETAVNGLDPGNNTIMWKITNGECESIDNITIVNNAVVANAGNLQNLCENNTSLEAINPNTVEPFLGTGFWSVVSGTGVLSNSLLYNSSVSNLKKGLNRFKWTVEEGICDDYSYVDINNNSVTAIANSQEECGESVTMDGNMLDGAVGLWTKTSNNSSVIVASSLGSTVITGIPYGSSLSFTWTVTKDDCTDDVTVQATNNNFDLNAGGNDGGCFEDYELVGDIPTGGFGKWTKISGAGDFVDATLYNTLVTGLQQGSNIFEWEVTKGLCTNNAQVTVTNNIPSTAIIATPTSSNRELCENTAGLSSIEPVYGTGKWTVASSAVFTNNSSNITTIENLIPGNNVVTWTVSNNGCESENEIILVNNEVNAEAGLEQNKCSDNTSLLAVDPLSVEPMQGVGSWSVTIGSGILSNSLSAVSDVSNLKVGLNRFTWTVEKGICDADDYVDIYNNSINAYANDKSSCEPEVTMDGNMLDGATGIWTDNSGSSAIITTPTSGITTITGIPINKTLGFTWTVTKGDCSDKIIVYASNDNFEISAGVDDGGCYDSYTFSGDAVGSGTGIWSAVSSNGIISNASSNNATVTGLDQGLNIFEWKVTKDNCTNSARVTITNNLPDEAIITSPSVFNRVVCENQATLQANNFNIGKGQWNVVGDATFSNESSYQTVINNLEPGNNVINWSITNSDCVNEDNIIILNNEVIADAGERQDLCENNTTLEAINPIAIAPYQGNGSWSVVNGPGTLANSLSNISDVSNLKVGLNRFVWTVVKEDCIASDYVEIYNNAVTVTASDQEECSETATLNGNIINGNSGIWTETPEGPANITDPTLNNTTVTGIPNEVTLSFKWTASNEICSDDITIQVTNNNFNLNAGGDEGGCFDNYVMNGEVIDGGYGKWKLNLGSGTFVNNTLYNTEVTGLQQGINEFEWEVTQNECTVTDIVTITNNIPSDAEILTPTLSNREVCDITTDLSSVKPVYGTGKWTILTNANFINANSNMTTVVGLEPGNNEIIWTITNDICESIDVINIVNNAVTAEAGVSQNLCKDSTKLAASNPLYTAPYNQGTGHWKIVTGNGILSNSMSLTSSVTNLSFDKNRVAWIVEKGKCSTTDFIDIYNNSIIAYATNQSECASEVTMDGNMYGNMMSEASGIWTDISGSDATITTPTSGITTVTGIPINSTLSFKWQVTNNKCSDSIYVQASNNKFHLSAGNDENICSDTYTFWGDEIENGIGEWTQTSSQGSILDASNNNAVVTNLDKGPNIFRWTVIRNDCPNYDEVTIVNDLPDEAVIMIPAVSNREVCESSTMLRAQDYSIGVGQWSKIGAATFVNASNYQTLVNNLSPGNNTIIWKITNENCETEEQINILNNMVLADAGGQQELCNDYTVLEAIDPTAVPPFQGNGSWKVMVGTGIVNNSLLNSSSVSNLQIGLNGLLWTVEKGICDDSDYVEIYNNSVVAVATDKNECDDTAKLDGNLYSGATGLWTEFEAGPAIITDPTLGSTTVTGIPISSTLSFVWTLKKGVCEDAITILVANNNFNVSAGGDDEGCFDNYILSGDDPEEGEGIWILRSGSGTFDNDSQYNTFVTDLQKGNNSFEWQVTRNSCVNSAQVLLTNNLPDEAKITSPTIANREICDNSILLKANNPSYGNGIGEWSINSGVGTFTEETSFQTIVYGIDPGVNSFKWTITKTDCESSAIVEVINNMVTAEAGPVQNLCADTTSLNAIEPLSMFPNQGIGHWINEGGGTSLIENSLLKTTRISGLQPNKNTFSWLVTLGKCSTYDNVNIYNNSVHANATDIYSCDNFADLTGNMPAPGESGVWRSYTDGITYENQSLYNSKVYNLTEGNNTLVWTIDNNICDDEAIINVTYTNPDVNAGIEKSICENYTYLAANEPNSGASGVWSVITGDGEFDNSIVNNPYVNNIQKGKNIYRWTIIESGCEKYDDVEITNNSPNVDAGTSHSTCIDNITLTGNQPETGETGLWQRISNNPVNIVSNTSYYTDVNDLSSGITCFEWTISNSDCSATDQVCITYYYINPNAGNPKSSCDGTANLMATYPPEGFGIWTAGGDIVFSNSLSNVATVSNLAQGVNTLTWTVYNGGCEESDNVEITSNSVYVNAGSPTNVCENYTSLVGNEPEEGGYGEWIQVGGAGQIENKTHYNTVVRNIGYGISKFTWTITQGECSGTDEVIINNKEVLNIFAGVDAKICEPSIKLAALNPTTGTGIWELGSGNGTFENASLYNTRVTGVGMGINKYVWLVDNGDCVKADTVTVTNYMGTLAITSIDTSICKNIYELVGNEPAFGETGIWTKEYGAQGEFSDPLSAITTVTNIAQGPNTYRWTISNERCSSYNDLIVTNSSISTDAGIDVSVCSDTTIIAADNPFPNTGIWSVENSGGYPKFDNNSNNNTVIRDLHSGSNIISWTITNGKCEAMDIVVVVNDIPTTASAGNPQTVCNGTTMLSGNNPSVGEGIWTARGGGVNTSIANPSNYNTLVTDLGTGNNLFRWTIKQGKCVSYDEVVILNDLVYASAGLPEAICGSYYPELNGNFPGEGEHGEWTATGSGVFENPTVYNTSVSGLAQGINTLIWTVYKGECFNSAEVSITNNTPSPASVGSNQERCVDFTTIAGNPPISGYGVWSVDVGNGVFEDSLSNITNVTLVGPGINQYRWSVFSGDCSSGAVITVVNNAVNSMVGDSISVCGVSTNLNGAEPNSQQNETGLWTSSPGTNVIIITPSLYNTEVTNLNKGENQFRWTISNGKCNDHADIVVVNNLYDANATIAGPDTTCDDFVRLLGNIPLAGSVGKWSMQAGDGYFDDEYDPTTIVRMLIRGNNTIRWSVTKGDCVNYDEVMITNHMVEALAGPDKIACGEDKVIVANELYDGEVAYWELMSGNGTILTPSNNETIVTDLGTGANIFRWNVYGATCSAFDDVVVSENSFHTSAGLDDNVCTSEATLTAQDPAPGYGIWSITASAGVTIMSANSFVTEVIGLQDYSMNTFRWTAYRNGCSDYDEVVVNNDHISAHAGGDLFTCEPTTELAAHQPIAGSGTWAILIGGGTIEDPENNTSPISGLVKGVNTLSWTVNHNGCLSVDQMVITNNMVTASAGDDRISCNDYINLAGEEPQNGGYGIWHKIAGPGIIQTPSAFNTLVTNMQEGINMFVWTIHENGCSNNGDAMIVTNNNFVTYAGDNQILPVGTTNTVLNAELPEGGNGYWQGTSGNGIITNPTSYDSEVTGMTTGENVFRWTVYLNDCSDYDEVSIFVIDFIPECGSDTSVCTGDVKLNARGEAADAQVWTKINGSGVFDNSSDPKTWVRNIGHGDNVYRWSVTINDYTAHCDVTVTENSFGISAGTNSAGLSQPHCEPSRIMNADPPGDGNTGMWRVLGTSGGTFENNTLFNTVVSNMNPGDNDYEWFVERGGCEARDTVTLIWNVPPNASFTTDPDGACAADSVEFTLNNTTSYLNQFPAPDHFYWSDQIAPFDETYSISENSNVWYQNLGYEDSTKYITLTAVTTYIDELGVQTQCGNSYTDSVGVWANPRTEFEVTPMVQMYPAAHFTIQYFGEDSIEYLFWKFGDGNELFQTEPGSNVQHEYATWGEYDILLETKSRNGCSNDCTVTIQILAPSPSSSSLGEVVGKGCEPLEVNFHAGVNYADEVIWDFGDNSEQSRSADTTHIYENHGTYYVTLKASGQGYDNIFIRQDTVIVYQNPEAEFNVNPKNVMIPNQPIICDNYSKRSVRWEWNLGDTIINEFRPSHYYTEPGVYDISLSVWSEKECFDSVQIKRLVYAERPGGVWFPNAFTPNSNGSNSGIYPCGDNYADNDHNNDVFFPINSGVAEYKLEIYNRWGEKIFESNDICTGWDGYVNNMMAPQDVYVWKVSGKYNSGTVFRKIGNVTLLR